MNDFLDNWLYDPTSDRLLEEISNRNHDVKLASETFELTGLPGLSVLLNQERGEQGEYDGLATQGPHL